MNIRLKTSKTILFFILLLGIIASFCLVTVKAETANTNDSNTNIVSTRNSSNNRYKDFISVFSFTPINETECDVRLSDKTATYAIIPDKVELNGKEYTVTVVAANGFSAASKLELVRIPDSVKTIGSNAFVNCKALTSITLPAVETIGSNAFAMTKLDYLIIPTTVTSVASTILRSTDTQVYVRASLNEGATTLEGWSSNWNGSNKNQTVEYNSSFVPDVKYEYVQPNSEIATLSVAEDDEPVVYEFDGYYVQSFQAFCTTEEDYEELHIPAYYDGPEGYLPVIGIEQFAFSGNSINKLIIDESDTSINLFSNAFNGYEGDEIIFNRKVETQSEGYNEGILDEISESVFAEATVSKIVLPNITYIGNYMFYGCVNLSELQFVDLSSQEQDSIESQENIGKNANSSNIIKLPSTVTFIGDYAFADVGNVLELYIPNSVKEVGLNIISGWTNQQTVYVDLVADDPILENWNERWAYGNNGVQEDNPKIIYKLSDTEYSITYNNDFDFHSNPDKYISSQGLELLPATRKGYTFEGWYLDENFETPIEKIEAGTIGDLSLYAKFIGNEYKINYEKNKPALASNPVAGDMEESTHTYGTTSKINENKFTLKGWIFIGWNTEADGTGDFYEYLDSVTTFTESGTKSLYAQWKQKTYTIIYIGNRPNGASSPLQELDSEKQETHNYEDKFDLKKAIFSLKGWTFEGWNTQDDGKGIAYEAEETVVNFAEEEIKLYAIWVVNNFIIKYEKNLPQDCSSSLADIAASTFTYDSDAYLKQSPTLIGYTFAGWTDAEGNSYNDGVNVKNIIPSGEMVLTAHWTANQFTIKYDKNLPENCSSALDDIADSTFTYDSDAYLRKVSLIGYTLAGWTDEKGNSYSDGANVKNKLTSGEMVLTAHWTANQFTIKYEKNLPTGCSSDFSISDSTFTYDSDAYLRKVSLIGYTFAGWTDEKGNPYSDGANVKNKLTSGEMTLTAHWTAKEYKIQYIENLPKVNTGRIDNLPNEVTHIYDTDNNLNGFYELTSWKMKHWLYNGEVFNSLESVTDLPDDETEVIILTAVWEEKELSECINSNGQYEIATATQLRNISTRSGYYYKLVGDIDVGYWYGLDTFNSYLDLNTHTITYKCDHLSTFKSYGFIIKNFGTIWNGYFKVYIRQDWANPAQPSNGMTYVGGVAAENYGRIGYVYVLSTIGEGNDSVTSSKATVDIDVRSNYQTIGGIAGINYSRIESCRNYASIAGSYNIGGIVGSNQTNAKIYVCTNYGRIWYCSISGNYKSVGGIAGLNHQDAVISNSNNLVEIVFAYRTDNTSVDLVFMAKIVGWCHPTATAEYCHGLTKPINMANVSGLTSAQLAYIKNNTDNISKVSETPQS